MRWTETARLARSIDLKRALRSSYAKLLKPKHIWELNLYRLLIMRLGTAIPSIIGVVIVTFLITRALPGDPAAYFAGPNPTLESIEEIRQQLGLDRSWLLQLESYAADLLHGRLGTSLTTGQPVLSELLIRLPASLELTFSGLLVAISAAIPLGVVAATRPGSWVDQVCRFVTTVGVCLPPFFTGLLLIYIFYYLLGWSPAPFGRLDIYTAAPATHTGFYTIDSLVAGNMETFRASLAQLILPAVSLGIFSLAPLARITRASMITTLSSDFIRTARASGLPTRKIVIGYALRNAILPVVTTLGMVFSFLLGANVMVEKVFAWPGVGSYAIDSLIASDYAPVQGFVLFMAILYILLNLVIDLIYGLLDPRFRLTT